MVLPSVPLWYYPLAGYCVVVALSSLRRIPRIARNAEEHGRRFGILLANGVICLGAVGLFLQWTWVVALVALLLALPMQRFARDFAIGCAQGRRNARQPAVAPPAGGALVLSRTDHAAGFVFVGLVRGLPVVLLLLAAGRM